MEPSDAVGGQRAAITDDFINSASCGHKLIGHDHMHSARRRVLIVGDSITHGGEADFTWRYRIWQWFQAYNISADFVGPYTGVNGRQLPLPPQPPRFPEETEPPPATNPSWGYNEDVDKKFQDRHFAHWGYQAMQCKTAIADVVRDSKANMMLMLLGFNDVGWWVSDADGTLDSIKAIVDNARAVEPNMQFAIGNIVNRSRLGDRNDLLENTKRFNEMLPHAASSWTSPGSPVMAVDVAKEYDAGPQYPFACPAAYDGLHPNALGEYQIARAFSITLSNHFYKTHSKPLKVPSHIPPRDLSTPSNILAQAAGQGAVLTWDHVFGAEYEVRHRVKRGSDLAITSMDNYEEGHPTNLPEFEMNSTPEWSTQHCNTNRLDVTDFEPGIELEFSVRSVHGFSTGSWSKTRSVTTKRTTAPPPTNIKTYPTRTGFIVKWDPPQNRTPPSCHSYLLPPWGKVIRYEVLWYDENVGGFPSNQGVRSDSAEAEVKGLTPGHRVQVRMRTWTAEGGGVFASGPTIRVGDQELTKPTNLRASKLTSEGVELTWTGCDSSTGYSFYARCLREKGAKAITNGEVIDGNRYTFEPVWLRPWDYELSVSAVNGSLQTERSAGLVPEQLGP